MMRALVSELRSALRRLRRSLGFTAAAVATLALGIGANTALFSVTNAVLLRPLPFPQPERLQTVWEQERDGTESNTGYPTFRDLADRNRTLEAAAAAGYWQPTLTGVAAPERLEGLKVSASFFGILGVRPQLGRDFRPEDDRPGADREVLVTWGLWQRRFGGDPALPGRLVVLDGLPHQVVGVLPRSFTPLLSTNRAPAAEVFKPLGYDATLPQACRGCRHLWILARLRPGVARESAERDLSGVMRDLAREHPTDYATVGAAVRPLQERLSRDSRPLLTAVALAAGFLLALACVNLAGLHLARGVERRPDVAIRAALGAGRRRLAAHVIAESVALALAGGALGVFVAHWGVLLLRSLAPAWVPRIGEARVDGAALAFALVVSLGCGLLLGALPALRAALVDPQEWLRDGSRAGAGPRRLGWQRALVGGQVALAAVLLVGSTLTLKSLGRLLDVPPGFEARGLVTGEVDVAYSDRDKVIAFYDGLVARLAAIPGTTAAGAASQIPLGGNFDVWGVHVEGQAAANPDEDPSADFYAVTPGYRRAMGIPLVRGRDLDARDSRNGPPVALVSESLARRFWLDDPLGKRLKLGGTDGPWRTVVGVVGDVRHHGLDTRPRLQAYVPHAQTEHSGMTLVLRSAAPPAEVARALRDAVTASDPDVPVSSLRSGADLVEAAVAERRFASRLLGLFALAAVGLVAVGLVGALAQIVSTRTREIGVRLVLGARRSQVLALLLRHGLLPALAGLGLGLAAAPFAARALAPILFEVSPFDPTTLAAAALAIASTAALACVVPARRAARVDPAVVLRGE